MYDITIYKNTFRITHCPDKCFSIIYINSGSAVISVKEDRVSVTSPACFCLNEKENFQIHESRNLSMTQILFHPEYINSNFDFENIDPANRTLPRSAELDKFYMLPFIDRDRSYTGYFSPDPEQDVIIRKKIKLLISDYADKDTLFRPCRKRSSLLELLLFLCRNYREKETGDADDTLVEKVISFFADNYQDKITISDLCSRFGTNRNTLAKKFRKERGVTVMESLAEIRVKMATSLLMQTELPVIDILYRVGFNDTAHFGRTFKRFIGTSPSEYRKSVGRKM